MSTTMIASPDDTEPRMPAAKPAPPAFAVPELQFPRHHLVAPTDIALKASIEARIAERGMSYAVYRIESVPVPNFLEWIKEILARERSHDLLMTLTIGGAGKRTSLAEKWRCVNVLAEHGINLSKYLFEDMESAAQAKRTLSGVESEGANG